VFALATGAALDASDDFCTVFAFGGCAVGGPGAGSDVDVDVSVAVDDPEEDFSAFVTADAALDALDDACDAEVFCFFGTLAEAAAAGLLGLADLLGSPWGVADLLRSPVGVADLWGSPVLRRHRRPMSGSTIASCSSCSSSACSSTQSAVSNCRQSAVSNCEAMKRTKGRYLKMRIAVICLLALTGLMKPFRAL
jgi:hypothetical protein